MHHEMIHNVLGHWSVMDENEQTPEVQSPLQRDILIASIASLVSLAIIYFAARPVVSLLQVWWMELLVYAIIPISVAFILLYRSCWHREITGAARTCSLLVISCIILGGDLIAIGALFCMALSFFCMIAFCVNGVSGGNH
jgi:uncharacterized RDD family membrane protein YckC